MCGSVGFNMGNTGLSTGFGGAPGGAYGMLGALTEGFGKHFAQQQEIEVGKKRQDDLYKRLVSEAVFEMQEAELAQQQANDASTQSKSEIAREMFRAREEAKAAASAAGVDGNTLNRLLTDISFTEQQKKAVVDTNRDNIVHTQQLQKHKAIQSTKISPYYYNSGGGIFNSMLGIVPGLFSGFNFSAGCSTTSKNTSTCGR